VRVLPMLLASGLALWAKVHKHLWFRESNPLVSGMSEVCGGVRTCGDVGSAEAGIPQHGLLFGLLVWVNRRPDLGIDPVGYPAFAGWLVCVRVGSGIGPPLASAWAGRGKCLVWAWDWAVVLGSFCCSGQHQETRQAKDHPKAAYEAWHTAWRYPFRARRDWQSQAHLHTTLNKSRDEKLEIVGAGATYAFGKRACIMGEGAKTTRSVGNRTRWDPS
jgi:hypothetical protein